MGPQSVMDWVVLIYGALFIIANVINIVFMFKEKEKNNLRLSFTNFSIAGMYVLMLVADIVDREFSFQTHWLELVLVVAWIILAILQVVLPLRSKKDE